jgi:hypothetical protein
MKNALKATVVALFLAGGSLAISQSASADHVTVSVGTPGIAFGYNDGYWDRERAWHAWRDRREAARWREANRDHYYAWRHDRDRDKGWREADRWWDRR